MAPAQQAYAGALSTKTKAELIEILKSLEQDTQGLKADLEDRLEQYLQDNEATLRDDSRYKGLYVARRKRRSPRGDSATPSVKESAPAEDLEAIKDATGHLAGKAYDAAAATYDQSVQPALNSAMEEGYALASRGLKRVFKKAKETTGLDEDSLRIPESPARALRSQASQAVDSARPVVENGVDKAAQTAERARRLTLQYWRKNGYRDSRKAIRDVQEYLSSPSNLIKGMLFLELVYLLVNLIPWNRHEFQFPPSKYSFHFWDRFLYAIFWWMPEIKQSFTTPQMFAMLNPRADAATGFGMWLIYTIVPPFLLSHIITFLPQPSLPVRKYTRRSTGSRQIVAPLPEWDPLVFCLIRFVLCLFPITSACPDFLRYQLEAFGNISGRALVSGLTGGFVLAHRLAALAD